MSKYKYIIHHTINDGKTNPALDEDGLTFSNRRDANIMYQKCIRSDVQEMHQTLISGQTTKHSFIIGLETVEEKTDRFIDYKEKEIKFGV